MIVQGQDVKVRMTMTDGTNPIKPSDLDAYAVSVYYLASGVKKQLAKFESTVSGAYGIDVFDDDDGKIDFIVNREITPKIPAGEVYGELWIKETATSEYILSKSKSGVSGVLLFEMTAAANPNLT